jgi:8-oxo-dGTP pyrophosphatase MutT (NUDIX family)
MAGEANPWLASRDQMWRYDPAWVASVLSRITDHQSRGNSDAFTELPTTPMRPPLFHRDGELRVLLTRRDGRLRSHKGEVAFPGGRMDEGETPLQAALRETHEEVGLPPERVQILGSIESLTTVISAAKITPFVGYVSGEMPPLTASPGEVDRIFDVSLFELTHPDCYHEEIWPYPDGVFPIWFFDVEDDTIWGATGRMVRRLLDLVLLSDP